MTPSVATASIFLLLLNGNTGCDQQVLGIFGIEGPQWLVDPALGQTVHRAHGVVGRQRHDGDLPRRAQERAPRPVRGRPRSTEPAASRKFFRITLPMISGAMFFNVIVLTIAALQVFDQAYLLYLRDTDQRVAGRRAVLRRLPVPAGLPAIQLRLRRGYGLAAVRHHPDLITVIQVKFGNRFVYYEGD